MNSVKKDFIDLLCFGGVFLQGFDTLNWKYLNDLKAALELKLDIVNDLRNLSFTNNINLLFGYIEKENDNIYSLCLFIEKGKIICNYRRISIG